MFQAAKDSAEQAGDQALAGTAAAELAMQHAISRRMDKAEAELWEARSLVASGENRYSKEAAFVEHCRGRLLLLSGDARGAESCFTEAAYRCTTAESQELLPQIYQRWGEALLEANLVLAAGEFLKKSLQLSRAAEGKDRLTIENPIIPGTLGLLARQSLYLGDTKQARKLLLEDRFRVEQAERRRELGMVLNHLAEVNVIDGYLHQAAELYTLSLSKVRSSLNHFFACVGLSLLALKRFDRATMGPEGTPRHSLLDEARARLEDAQQCLDYLAATPKKELLQLWASVVGLFIGWRRAAAGEHPENELKDIADKLEAAAQDMVRHRLVSETAEVFMELLWLYRQMEIHSGGLGSRKIQTCADHFLKTLERMGATPRVQGMERWLKRYYPLQFMRIKLDRFVPAMVLPEKIIERELTVLVLDIRGFSQRSQGMKPADIFAYLSEIFRILNTCVEAHQGVSFRYIGDMLLATFGALEDAPDLEPPEARAVRCALQMQEEMAAHTLRRKGLGQDDVEVGIGLHRGMVAVGRLMTLGRWEYTIHGEVVNTAAHLEQQTKERGVTILATREVLERAGQVPCGAQELDPITLKAKVVSASEVKPIVRFRASFAKPGDKIAPREGSLALGLGRRAEAGMIAPLKSGSEETCTTILLVDHPPWVTKFPIKPDVESWDQRPEFILPRDPDLDCCAAAYLAQELLETGNLPRRARDLALYINNVVRDRPPRSSNPEDSPYQLVEAALALAADEANNKGLQNRPRSLLMLERGMHLIGWMIHRLAEKPAVRAEGIFSSVEHPFVDETRRLHDERLGGI